MFQTISGTPIHKHGSRGFKIHGDLLTSNCRFSDRGFPRKIEHPPNLKWLLMIGLATNYKTFYLHKLQPTLPSVCNPQPNICLSQSRRRNTFLMDLKRSKVERCSNLAKLVTREKMFLILKNLAVFELQGSGKVKSCFPSPAGLNVPQESCMIVLEGWS